MYDEITERLKRKLQCTNFLKPLKANQTQCPWCAREGHDQHKDNLHYYPETNTVNCFASHGKHFAIDLYMITHGISDFTEAKDKLKRKMELENAAEYNQLDRTEREVIEHDINVDSIIRYNGKSLSEYTAEELEQLKISAFAINTDKKRQQGRTR